MATGKGFWRPKAAYVIAISAAAAPKAASPNDGARPPPGMHSYEVEVRGRARESLQSNHGVFAAPREPPIPVFAARL